MHPIKDLNYTPKVEKQNGEKWILCQIREKWYQWKPEEEVRQLFIAFLLKKGYRSIHIRIEHPIKMEGKNFKADIVVFEKGKPIIIIECKRDEIDISHKAFEQVNNYNKALQAEWVVVTNGLYYTVRRYDKQTGKLLMTEDLPPKSWHTLTFEEYAKTKIALENQLFELQRMFVAQHCPYKIGDTIEYEGRLHTIKKITLQDPISLSETYLEVLERLEKQAYSFDYELQLLNHI